VGPEAAAAARAHREHRAVATSVSAHRDVGGDLMAVRAVDADADQVVAPAVALDLHGALRLPPRPARRSNLPALDTLQERVTCRWRHDRDGGDAGAGRATATGGPRRVVDFVAANRCVKLRTPDRGVRAGPCWSGREQRERQAVDGLVNLAYCLGVGTKRDAKPPPPAAQQPLDYHALNAALRLFVSTFVVDDKRSQIHKRLLASE